MVDAGLRDDDLRRQVRPPIVEGIFKGSSHVCFF